MSARVLAWLIRLLFALVVVGGALSTVALTPIEGEGDLFEEVEDERIVEAQVLPARSCRQVGPGKPGTGAVERLEIPRVLGQVVAGAARPPRRTSRRVPPGEDDEDDAARS